MTFYGPGPVPIAPCPFCGNADPEFLATGPVGESKITRSQYRAVYCLLCNARGPRTRRDAFSIQATIAWNRLVRRPLKDD